MSRRVKGRPRRKARGRAPKAGARPATAGLRKPPALFGIPRVATRLGGLLGIVVEVPSDERVSVTIAGSLLHGGLLGIRDEPGGHGDPAARLGELGADGVRPVEVDEARRLVWGFVAFGVAAGVTDLRRVPEALGMLLPPPAGGPEAWLDGLAEVVPETVLGPALELIERRQAGREPAPRFLAEARTEGPFGLRLTLDTHPFEFAYDARTGIYAWSSAPRDLLGQDAPRVARIAIESDGRLAVAAPSPVSLAGAVLRLLALAPDLRDLEGRWLLDGDDPTAPRTEAGGLIHLPALSSR